MLSRLVITFLPRSKSLLISLGHLVRTVRVKIKSFTVPHRKKHTLPSKIKLIIGCQISFLQHQMPKKYGGGILDIKKQHKRSL